MKNTSLILAAFAFASSASAVTISTLGVEVTENFDGTSGPTLSNWGTKNFPGGAYATESALDAGVQTFTVSGLNALAEMTSAGSNQSARWSQTIGTGGSGGLYTQATGGGFVPLVAIVTNTSGSTIGQLSLSYDFAATGTGGGPLPGQHVYYSSTGLANSWQKISAISGVVSQSTLSAVIGGLSLANNSSLYVLWADDDYDTFSEPGYSMDNVKWTASAVPEPSTYGLMGAGALAAAALVRRRRKSA